MCTLCIQRPPEASVDKEPELMRLVVEFLEKIDPAVLVSEGRVYGGGLYKLEPKELMRVAVGQLIDALDLDLRSESIQPTLNFA